MRMNMADRVLGSSVPEPNSGCWLWLKRVDPDGYARIDGACSGLAHRVSYSLFRGPLDPTLTIDHLCRVRSCVNPAHLEQVSIGVNSFRGDSRSSINARKTSCKYGHPFDAKNTYRFRGKRSCRQCNLARVRAGKEGK